MIYMDNAPGNLQSGMKMIERKSAVPIYAFAATWVVFLLLFNLYKLSNFIAAGILSVAVYFVLNKMIPAKVEYVAAPTVMKDTGSPEANSLIEEGANTLAYIRVGRGRIKNQSMVEKINRIDDTCSKILAFVSANPEAAKDLRKFMNYYLPTLLKLVDSYGTFEAQGIKGENITSAMQKTENVLDTMAKAFEKQLDALFGDTALDITTDISVMEGMLAQEGLTDGPNTMKFN